MLCQSFFFGGLGRTGRYTLVERWKTNEKMLPPAEHPLQVGSDAERGIL